MSPIVLACRASKSLGGTRNRRLGSAASTWRQRIQIESKFELICSCILSLLFWRHRAACTGRVVLVGAPVRLTIIWLHKPIPRSKGMDSQERLFCAGWPVRACRMNVRAAIVLEVKVVLLLQKCLLYVTT